MAKEMRNNLGFLGVEFQYSLVKTFIEYPESFREVCFVVDQNMFTDPTLKRFVGVYKEFYDKYYSTPNYDELLSQLNLRATSDMERTYNEDGINKLKNETKLQNVAATKEISRRFFVQQSIVKAANQILNIVGNGDADRYDDCVSLMQSAMNVGKDDDMGTGVFDDLDETLSEDYRCAIPTGVDIMDKVLEGGLGKGELGVIIGPSSFGKALPIDEIVYTPNGPVKNGDLKIGDYVIGKNGKPTKVTGVFPQGTRMSYKVTFSDGVSVRCDKQHLWQVYDIKERKTRVLTLSEMMNEVGNEQRKYRKYEIPICDPVEFEHKEVSDSIIEHCMYCGSLLPLYDEYKYNDIETRVKVLHGLIVSGKGGSYIDNGACVIVDNIIHAKNIQEIVWSLGGLCDIIVLPDDTYQIDMHVQVDEIELLSRPVENHRFISSVQLIGLVDMQCIKVDAEDELYLTKNYIVTHNTSLTTAMAAYAATYRSETNNNNGFKVVQIVFEDKIKQIRRKHLACITGVEAKDLSKPDYIQSVRSAIDVYNDKELLRNNLIIKKFYSGQVSVGGIKQYLTKLINEGFRPDLCIIDYFECIELEKAQNHGDKEYTREGLTMRKIETMADELNMAVWVPTQGNRESITSDIVTMDKSGGSIKKIQIGHIVLSISRSLDDISNNLATFTILKNRSGSAGKIMKNISFNNGTCRISTDNVETYESMSSFNSSIKDEAAMDAQKALVRRMKNNK